MASMKCGACKGTHGSVADVRACYGQAPAVATARPTLADQGVDNGHLTWLRETLVGGQHAHAASHGYYAVTLPGETALRFFRVDTPRTGRYAGKAFVGEQASDTVYPVKNRARVAAIYTAILAVGMAEAQRRYGQELEHGGRCNRTLTDETSRARGIGPDCWEMMGVLA